MRATFHLKTLSVAVAALSVASLASAAGLDRSGQDITAFLQDGTYAETVYTYINADVTGYDNQNVATNDQGYVQGNKTGDVAETYDFFRYGVKADINDTFSVGVLYDEPFGAAAAYSGESNFVTDTDTDALVSSLAGSQGINSVAALEGTVARLQGALSPGNPGNLTPQELAQAQGQLIGLQGVQGVVDTAGQGSNVEVRSHNLTAILGMKLGENKNFQIYGGPVAQRIEADVKLRGIAYGPATGYTSNSNPDMDYGYIAGFSFSKPEIALKAALTYRSEIDHDIEISETYPLAPTIGAIGTPPRALLANQTSRYEITTPKSVNFDFQTGINPTTLATAKVRWVPWGDFAIVPPLYNEVSKIATNDDKGLPLVSYDKDQWQIELGLAKRLSQALAVSGTVGWDSGAGDPTSSLGPVEGYYSAGLGAKYNVTENWAVSAGGKYLWFGDAKGELPNKSIVGNFEDNDGYIVGVKLSYQGD